MAKKQEFSIFAYFSPILPLLPDPPILAFFDFLAFFCFPISLAFWGVFPFFSKDLRGSAKRKPLLFSAPTLAFSKKSKGWRVRAFCLFFAYFSSYFLELGAFLFCSWPTQSQHQNRTIAIASDLRVDGAKSPEILQKEGVLGSDIAARNRKSLATFQRTLKLQCSIALSCLGNRCDFWGLRWASQPQIAKIAAISVR